MFKAVNINILERVSLSSMLPFILIILFFTVTTIIRAQSLGMHSFLSLSDGHIISNHVYERPNIIQLILLPATLAVLNFYFLFIAFQQFDKNKKRFYSYLGLWLIQWLTITWHMSAFYAYGIQPPIIEKWPLALGFFISTSMLSIFLSLRITRLLKDNMAAKKLIEDQKQAHKMKLASLETELDEVNSQMANQPNSSDPLTDTANDLTTIIEENKHIKFVTELTNSINTLIDNPDLDCKLLASTLCMSEKTLQRKIANTLDMTPGVFIKNSRMQHAKKMMTEDGITSRKQLAFAVGFKNVSYFSKVFDKYLEQGL